MHTYIHIYIYTHTHIKMYMHITRGGVKAVPRWRCRPQLLSWHYASTSQG